MSLLNDSEARYEKLPDFGPDTADAVVAAFVEDRIEDFHRWLDERAIPYDVGPRQWLRLQKRRRAGFKAVTEALE